MSLHNGRQTADLINKLLVTFSWITALIWTPSGDVNSLWVFLIRLTILSGTYCVNFHRCFSLPTCPWLIIIWTHKRHPIARPHGWAIGCLLWVFLIKLTILLGVHFIYFHRWFSLHICPWLIIIWTHKRHPISRPHGRAIGCLLWVFLIKLTILSGVHFIYFHRCFSLRICPWLIIIWTHKRHPISRPHGRAIGCLLWVFLAATKQLYKWYFPSVRPSVCLSVCPSVRHTFLTMFPSSYHHEIFRSYYQWQKWRPCKRSRSEVKGQGHRGHNPTLPFPDCNSSLNSRMMMKWCIQLGSA